MQRQEQLLQGLSTREVEERRARGLGCVPPPVTGRSYLQIFRDNVLNTINLVLFSIALALVILGQYLDAFISVGVVTFNMIISLAQEVRAKRMLDRIALLARPQAPVLRDGQEQVLAPTALVVGDLLVVHPGDQIVADGPLVGPGSLEVDESLLTGEANLVAKHEGDMLYSGTFCVTGSALYRADRVGRESMAGALTTRARAYRQTYTPLQREINLIIRVLFFVALYLEGMLYLASMVNFVPVVETVRMAMVVIGIVPNGLFLCISVAYALGAVRLAGKGALVQKFNAIESLSHVDVLCLDKTGTLTANSLQLARLHAYGRDTTGRDTTGRDTTAPETLLGNYVAHTSSPNATSDALGVAYQRLAVRHLRVLQEIPFSSARKWSALVVDDAAMRGVYVLGAPDILRPFLAPACSLGPFLEEETRRGLRVLLFAYYPEPLVMTQEQLPQGLLPLAAISLRDQLRPEAHEAIERFLSLGVSIKIISGDHPQTVAALATQVGLGNQLQTITGSDLDAHDDAQRAQVIEETTIFGRITPEQKEHIVAELRRQHHYVAMIGDGVNDVLSLKKANLGIAMQSGSQATRGVADLLLLQDSFAALPQAISEGQRICHGMQDILKLFLTRVASMTLLLISISFIGSFPFQPRQTSLLTLLTVGVPALALTYWARPGRVSEKSLLRTLMRFVLPAAVTICLIAIGVYLAILIPATLNLPAPANPYREGAQPLAQTGLTIFLVLCGLILLLFLQKPDRAGSKKRDGHFDWRPLLLALSLFVCLVVVLAVPPLRALFNLQALPASTYLLIMGTALLWALLQWLIWRFHLFELMFQWSESSHAP